MLFASIGIDLAPFIRSHTLFDSESTDDDDVFGAASSAAPVSWLTLEAPVNFTGWRTLFQRIREDEAMWSRLLSKDQPSPTRRARRIKATRVALTKATRVAQLRLDHITRLFEQADVAEANAESLHIFNEYAQCMYG